MNSLPDVTEEFRSEIIRRSPLARVWLDELPGTLQALQRLWNLDWDGPPAFGKTSMVVPVHRATGPAALKLVSPAGHAGNEIRALELLAGRSVVSMLDSSLLDRAILLERLNPEQSPLRLRPQESLTIAGGIATSIASMIAPDDVQSLASDSEGWLTGIGQQHARAESHGDAVPLEYYEAARDAIRLLGTLEATHMTHGDLSFDNIMQTSEGNWVAIDPLLTRGPIIHEAHTVVRTLLPGILESDHPRRLLMTLTRRFCDVANADYEMAQRLSLARYVASYYWESQHGGDERNIARLKAAAHLTYELIT